MDLKFESCAIVGPLHFELEKELFNCIPLQEPITGKIVNHGR